MQIVIAWPYNLRRAVLADEIFTAQFLFSFSISASHQERNTMQLTTTFKLLRKASACTTRYSHLRKAYRARNTATIRLSTYSPSSKPTASTMLYGRYPQPPKTATR